MSPLRSATAVQILGEVTPVERFRQNGTRVAGQPYEYDADDIGNRQTSVAKILNALRIPGMANLSPSAVSGSGSSDDESKGITGRPLPKRLYPKS